MAKRRTQIQLEPEEHAALLLQARRRGISMSQAIREAIRRSLGLDRGDEELRRRFLAAAGTGREPDAHRDVARRHDDFLYGGRR